MTDIERLQRQKCAEYGAEFAAVGAEQMVGVSRSLFSGRWPINGLRHPPEAGTTGWYLWSGTELSDTDDFFAPIHVQHVLDEHSKLAQYLGLAPGWRFLFDDTHEDVWYDPLLLKA
jgi:hypothetical protein